MPILMDSDGNPVYLPPTAAEVEAAQQAALAGIDQTTAEIATEKLQDS